MDALSADQLFLFEGFWLNRRSGGLFHTDENDTLVPVAIGSRALELLILLVTRHGELVSKDEIMNTVWPGMIVADSNLPTQISALRRVLDQERSNGSCIQTVAGRGYRFVAEVTHPPAEVLTASPWVSSTVANRQPIAAPPLSLVVLPFENFRHLRSGDLGGGSAQASDCRAACLRTKAARWARLPPLPLVRGMQHCRSRIFSAPASPVASILNL